MSPAGPALAPRPTALALAALVCLTAIPAAGQLEVPADRQVLILSRALSYDSEIKNRVGGDIMVGILSKPGHAASEAMAAAMYKAFRAILNVKVQGLSLGVRTLAYTTPTGLGVAVANQGIDVLYVCAGLDADLPGIIEVSRKRHVITMGSSEGMVSKGLSLGVFPLENRPTIVVNLVAARNEGASFSTELLRVAKVIKAPGP